MQFHLNGYRPGGPAVANLTPARMPARDADVDVLIVGCGPAGLTLAAQFAAFPADGIACRTMEMFQAFGLCERVLHEVYWVNETSFWQFGATDGTIARGGRVHDTEDGISE